MIIIEGKLEDLTKKYVPKFDKERFVDGITPESLINHLYESDPSPTKKYFEWMIKVCLDIIDGNYVIDGDIIESLLGYVNVFNNNIHKIDNEFLDDVKKNININTYNHIKGKPLTDINTYTLRDLTEISRVLRDYKTKTEKRRLAKEGAKLLFQDEKYKVYEIDTYEASCFFGAGSKWCTTNKETDSNFKTYGTGSKKLLYVISKTKTQETDPQFYKIAINIKYDDNQITFWDAPDKSFDGWGYFNLEDPKILKFLEDYIKEKAPDKFYEMFPDEYLFNRQQEEDGLSDLEFILRLDITKSSKFLSYKYNLTIMDAIVKKLDLLIGNIEGYLGDYFPNGEIDFLIKHSDDILTPRNLTWRDFVKSYHELAVTTEYLPNVFIDKFLGGDKNKIFKIAKDELILVYWLARGDRYLNDLGKLYGAEKIIKSIVKNKVNVGYSLSQIIDGLLTVETPKKRKELYEIVYGYSNIKEQIDLSQYLVNKLGKSAFIASFNNGNGRETEPESYRRAFLYLKKENPDLISDVFNVKDVRLIFKTEEAAFSYFIKYYDEFTDNINLTDLAELFSGEIPESIFGKYMSSWEKTQAIYTFNKNNGCKKLFDFVLKKFSFKKLADIIGYDEVFQLFSIVKFKKGINYMVENKIGDISIDDIRIQNGKPILVVNDRKDYAFLFDNEDLASSVLGEDMDWEMYDDVVYNWYNQVWGCMEPKSIELVKDWIKSNVLEYENDEGETIDLGDTYLNEISDDELGHIINGYSEFEDLKKEMSWAYDSAYNSAAQDEIVTKTQDDLETYLGKYIGYEPIKKVGRRYNKEKGTSESYEYTNYVYLYDLGNLFYDTLYDYASSQWGYSLDYNTYYSTLLKESEPEKLDIDTDPYPDDDDICEYFNEELFSRI